MYTFKLPSSAPLIINGETEIQITILKANTKEITYGVALPYAEPDYSKKIIQGINKANEGTILTTTRRA